MNDDPIVAEVRRIRLALWQEAGCDLNRLAELARQEAAKIPNLGPRIENAMELRRYIEKQEAAPPALREEPPRYGKDSAEKS
jgi:hypothetical protein